MITIFMAAAGATLGFQLPEMANDIGGHRGRVPLGANLMTAFAGAVLFYWMAS